MLHLPLADQIAIYFFVGLLSMHCCIYNVIKAINAQTARLENEIIKAINAKTARGWIMQRDQNTKTDEMADAIIKNIKAQTARIGMMQYHQNKKADEILDAINSKRSRATLNLSESIIKDPLHSSNAT